MNAMIASGGYHWTVIRQARRSDYLSALESASTEGDIAPFAKFVAKEMEREIIAGKIALPSGSNDRFIQGET